MISKEYLESSLPKGYSRYCSEEIVEKVREACEGCSEDLAEYIEENLVTYIRCVEGMRCRPEAYINAVKYCSMRLMGESIVESWKRTFPRRCERIGEECRGNDSFRDYKIKNNADYYNKTVLVTKIMGMSLVPSWIVNAQYYQEGINKLVEIIRDEGVRNGMVKVRACEALINATKKPEVIEQKIELGGNVEVGSEMMKELREVTDKLAIVLGEGIKRGKGLREVSEIELVCGKDGKSYE